MSSFQFFKIPPPPPDLKKVFLASSMVFARMALRGVWKPSRNQAETSIYMHT